MLNTIGFWCTAIAFAMLVWYELKLGKRFGPILKRLGFVIMSSFWGSAGEVSPGSSTKNEGNPALDEPKNPENLALQSRTHAGTSTFTENPAEPIVLALSNEECQAIARMIIHRSTAERFTKASAINAGFGVSKGGSIRYKRASEIYDALFDIDFGPEYKELDSASRPQQLALEK
jgi:hypothetical protein